MLNTTQLQTLKTHIAADPVMSTMPMNGDGDYDIAILLNKTALPAFQVWSSNVSTSDVYNTVNWANMTPATPSASDATGLYRDRALACQGKQFNLQTILQGRDLIDATKPNLRAGLQDSLTSLPSGVSGATQGAGWAAVQLILQRTATVVEKLFATGTGTTASPATVVITNITSQDVNSARNS